MATVGGLSSKEMDDLFGMAAEARIGPGGFVEPGVGGVSFGGMSTTGSTAGLFSDLGGSPIGNYSGTYAANAPLTYEGPPTGNPFRDPVPVDPRNTAANALLRQYGFQGAVDRYRERFLAGADPGISAGQSEGRESVLGDNMAQIIEAVKQRIEDIVSPTTDNTRRGRFGF